MAIKKQYAKSQETAIASYNYTDIATGAGNILFYGGDVSGSAILTTTSTMLGYNGYTRTTNGSPTTTTITFDATFERPVNLRGKGYIVIPYGYRNDSGGTLSFSPSVVYTLNKVDAASVSTSIGSGSGGMYFNTITDGSYGWDNVTFEFNITTTLHLKTGDTLRFTATIPKTPNASTFLYMGHDPANRTNLYEGAEEIVWTTSQLQVSAPFKIDL
jgi:hypothetical protein